MDLFGYEFKRKEKDVEEELLPFSPEETDDGALVVAPGGSSGVYIDLEGAAKNDAELITKYRNMYNQAEMQNAVDKICNEAIVKQPDKPIVEINLDGLQQSQKVKDAIKKEWRAVEELLNLNNNGYAIFQRWYVDARLPYHAIIDQNNPKAGIKELRYIDPRKLRKIRTTKAKKAKNAIIVETGEEFYVYNEKGFKSNSVTSPSAGNNGLKIAGDAIIYITSGLTDADNQMVLGYLHKAIRPLNQLRMLEDATVIYRTSRAAERRLFYIDVGNLPKAKAEQYLRDMMAKHKNRLVYDSVSGEIRDDRKFQTMYEDMWFPTRGGQSGTKIETLPAGQNLGELSDVQYFKGKLYEALNLPMSRLEQGSTFGIGRSSEISRDELEFQKFVDRLRARFSQLFLESLGKQLILRGIITKEDWEDFRNKITFDFARDNYYAELKDAEILTERLTLLGEIDNFEGKYFSKEWAQKNVLKMTDDEINKMAAQVKKERKDDAAQGIDQNTYKDFDSEQNVEPPVIPNETNDPSSIPVGQDPDQ